MAIAHKDLCKEWHQLEKKRKRNYEGSENTPHINYDTEKRIPRAEAPYIPFTKRNKYSSQPALWWRGLMALFTQCVSFALVDGGRVSSVYEFNCSALRSPPRTAPPNQSHSAVHASR
eukprot:1142080-Pelagomonas_calceolata.AAC.1